MILLDTHIWLWWLLEPQKLSRGQAEALSAESFLTAGVAAVSCWEVAWLASRNRVELRKPPAEWFAAALAGSNVELVSLSPQIAVDAVNLPGEFHKDPADRQIVATARTLGCPLLTADGKILAYEHVETVG